MLRRRNNAIEKIRELDVFSKVPEPYVKQSVIGGTFSIISFLMIIYLIYGETKYFLESRLQFKFEPDVDIHAKVKINLDITVAMPCQRIGADFVDSTHDIEFEQIHEEDTWWDLTTEQRMHFDMLKQMNTYFSEEYHAIHELLWKSNKFAVHGDAPKRDKQPFHPPDACRVHGSVNVNKVVGNFHIVTGQLMALPRNHIHIAAFDSDHNVNFSHRINKFSFGEPSPGIIHPLEGDEKIADKSMMSFQYYIDVVQTDINLLLQKSKTFQYSVKNYARVIDHNKGSHGIPGIFVQYDTSSLKVTVSQQRDSVVQFLVKLCATVGGIYVTNGLLNMIFQAVIEFIQERFFCKSDYKILNTPTQRIPDLINVPPVDVNFALNK